MGKHLNTLEKEFLIRQYKSNPAVKLRDFCESGSDRSKIVRIQKP